MRSGKHRQRKGDALAQYNLGVFYRQGRQGVEQDFKEAVKWYQKAADQGNAIGQYYLAVMYESGEGVKQDYATAYAFLNIAATNGLQEARKNLPPNKSPKLKNYPRR